MEMCVDNRVRLCRPVRDATVIQRRVDVLVTTAGGRDPGRLCWRMQATRRIFRSGRQKKTVLPLPDHAPHDRPLRKGEVNKSAYRQSPSTVRTKASRDRGGVGTQDARAEREPHNTRQAQDRLALVIGEAPSGRSAPRAEYLRRQGLARRASAATGSFTSASSSQKTKKAARLELVQQRDSVAEGHPPAMRMRIALPPRSHWRASARD